MGLRDTIAQNEMFFFQQVFALESHGKEFFLAK